MDKTNFTFETPFSKTLNKFEFDPSKYKTTSPTTATQPTPTVTTQPKATTPTTTTTAGIKTTPTAAKTTTTAATSTKKTGKSAEDKYQEALRQEIQNAYQQQIDYLTAQEQNLQSQLPTQLEQIGSQYEALRPGLQSQLELQQKAGEISQEDIRAAEQANLANIRRTAEEQGLRAVQQFGGVAGSSAGQAAGELIAREQLRTTGAARTQAAQNIQNVQQQLRTIQAEYDSNINKLNLEKERALQTARTEFNRQLDTIRQSKMQAGVTKSSQTIQALQDFATRRRVIEDQATALTNNLTLLKQQAESQAGLLRLQASLATPATTKVDFGRLFEPGKGQTIGQSNEAAKLLQSLVATGNLSKYGVTDLGTDPITKERLYQTDYGIIDSSGNLRSGLAQYQKQNPGLWESLFGK